jgi:ferric-dicitrate binding protein FerR (iron transport regulator)
MAHIDSSPEWDRVSAYLFEQLPPAERRAFEDELAQSPELRAGVAAGRRGLDALRQPLDVESQLAGRERLMHLVRSQHPLSDQPRPETRMPGRDPSPRNRLWGRAPLLAAVGTAVALVAGIFAYPHARHQSPRTYTTPAGQQARVMLGHGASAVLAPRTTVTVTTDETGTRLTVAGQALFHVESRPDAPFVVVAGNTATRVLGTTFMVRRYTDERTTQILVIDGRVALATATSDQTHAGSSRAAGQLVLTAGMLGRMDDSGQVAVVPRVPVDRYLAWTRGELKFEQAPIAEIVAELRQVYGAQIQLGDSALARRRLTWTVPVERQSLAEVLDALADALDAHYRRAGDTIVIVAGRVQTPNIRPSFLPLSKESQYGK